MPHIVRLPSGYQVRFNLRGRQYDSRHFVDREDAEACLASLPPEPPRERSTPRNNTSGMVGIRLEWRTYHARENVHAVLVVSYRDARGRARNTSISLARHGIEPALRRALELRGEPEKLAKYVPLVMAAIQGSTLP